MKHRWLAAGLSLAMLASGMTGCGRKHVRLESLEQLPIMNYTAPEVGDEIVTIHVRDYGDITVRLFPELLPEACENFLTLAEQGYYDELIFHRVIKDFVIQGGDPKGDGTGGESCWGGTFNGGYTPQLLHLPGALAYANSAGVTTDGSQFYIVTGQETTEDVLDIFTEYDDIYYTEEARTLYQQYGGCPDLDGGSYTVFGQVIDGLDVVFAISNVEVDTRDDLNKPIKAVFIDSVTVERYDGSPLRFYAADYGMQ